MIEDAGMELCGVIESEDELQEWLEGAFEDAGWTAIREVSPHGSNLRADLLVQHEEFGWFGVETKFIGKSQGPINLAKAHHQIVQQYRGRRYLGNKIDLWAVCPYIRCAHTTSDEHTRFEERKWSQVNNLQPFFQHSGIGWINLDHYALSMRFIYADSSGRVPTTKLAEKYHGEYEEKYRDIVRGWFDDVDMEAIRRWAANSVADAHYGRPNVIKETGQEVTADD
jgi:hypothetical protein